MRGANRSHTLHSGKLPNVDFCRSLKNVFFHLCRIDVRLLLENIFIEYAEFLKSTGNFIVYRSVFVNEYVWKC